MNGTGRGTLYLVAPGFGDPSSAANSRYRALIAAAGPAGWRVMVCTPEGPRDPDSLIAPQAGAPDNRRSPSARAVRELWTGARLAFQIPADGVVLIGLPPFFTALVVATACRLRRRRYLMDIRDIYPDVLAASGLVRPGSLAFRLLDGWKRFALRGATLVIGATQDLVSRLRDRVPAGHPVTFVRNGYAACFAPAAAPEVPPLIVSHGTLGRFQDTALLAEVILEARRRGKDWRFLVVGDGPTAYALERAAGAGFTWIRALSQEDLARRLAGGAVGVSLRTRDEISAGALPVRMLEYLGLGIPVLIHPRSEGGAEVARNGFGVEVEVGSADAVIAALEAMLLPEAQATRRAAILARRGEYAGPTQWTPFLATLRIP